MPLPEPTTQSIAQSHPPVGTTALLVKALVLFFVAVLVFVLYQTTPLKTWFDEAGPAKQWFLNFGAWGVVVFLVSASMLILLGVPRLLLCPLAGALYGFWGGLAVSLASTMISYYIGFHWIRGREHHGIERAALPKRLAFLAGDPGFTGVAVGRLLPVPGMVVTTALAVSNVRVGTYLLGSAIGLIPEAVPMVLAGTMPTDFKKWARIAGFAMLCLLGGWLVLRYLAKRFNARAQEAAKKECCQKGS